MLEGPVKPRNLEKYLDWLQQISDSLVGATDEAIPSDPCQGENEGYQLLLRFVEHLGAELGVGSCFCFFFF